MRIHFSQLLGKPVWDAEGRKQGRCEDLLVAEGRMGFPILRALALQGRGRSALIPADDVAHLHPSIILRTSEPGEYSPIGDELRLKDQVLDRQIVDIEGRRLVRANDLQLLRNDADGRFYLVGVETGTRSLLRRIGVEGVSARLLGLVGRQPATRVIAWQDVASVPADAPIRLRVTRERLKEMDPVDIAAIISDMDRSSGQSLLETLDTETAADAIQEVHPEMQAALIGAMAPEKAADLLEEMDPDAAADLLGDLAPEDRANLLALMERPEASDVQKLLDYPEDTAGGIMTTEYSVIPVGLCAREALEYLRQSPRAQEDEALYYVHVADEKGRLQGVVSLRDLVMADPQVPVSEIMVDRPVSVQPLTPQKEVARLVARYNLLAIPVVDQDQVLQGIVTVDDAIDAFIPTAWKKRLPRFF
ncbi:MAG: CBS domain-containing protein [Anaerolineae bacterium]|nr:CBS domain-containing protein [Anaerolineae bacterium]